MGSFQQVIMGATCLAAVFFFGNYLHNRPAANEEVGQSQLTATDPIDSIMAFGQKPTAVQQIVKHQPATQQSQGFAQLPAAPVLPSIDPSELAPAAVSQRAVAAQNQPTVVPAVTRKAVVPDFSELASRFRNTPLELNEAQATTGVNARGVHASERVPYSGTFEAPKMVIRQPEIQPTNQFRSPVDQTVEQVEQSIRQEFSSVKPDSARWRVNRSSEIDQYQEQPPAPRFQVNRATPQPDTGPRETIDDVLSRRSADWLKEDEPTPQTWATNPPQEGWASERRQKVTEQAALRNRGGILEVEDPGNRFRSEVFQVEDISPPEPDFDTAYYTPTEQRQDATPPRATTRIQTIRSNGSSNWGRQSNIRSQVNQNQFGQKQFGKSYEIQPGDTLQSISTRFFGSADHYLEIYKANREVLDRINSSPAGVVIEIPNLNN